MSSIFRREQRALPQTIDPYGITNRPIFQNWSGEVVTEFTSFASSALLGCVTLLADSIAAMPLERVAERGSQLVRMPTPTILTKPNDEQSQFEFIHQMMISLGIHGVAYVYHPFGSNGDPLEMRILPPRLVKPEYDPDRDARVWKLVKSQQVLSTDEVTQIDWIRMPGALRSLSPIEVMRNTIGVSLAMDRFLAQFYGEGAIPSSILESDKPVTPEQAAVLRDTWEDSHWKRRRPAVLSNGLRWRSIVTSAADAQMLEHREAVVRDIARAYRVPAHLINTTGSDSMTYQNVESAGINFVRHTLLPWMRRIEDAISAVLPPGERVRFNPDEFLRADLRTRVMAQQTQIASGTLTPNEARAIEGREPYVGGDDFMLALPGAPMAGGADMQPVGVDSAPDNKAVTE